MAFGPTSEPLCFLRLPPMQTTLTDSQFSKIAEVAIEFVTTVTCRFISLIRVAMKREVVLESRMMQLSGMMRVEQNAARRCLIPGSMISRKLWGAARSPWWMRYAPPWAFRTPMFMATILLRSRRMVSSVTLKRLLRSLVMMKPLYGIISMMLLMRSLAFIRTQYITQLLLNKHKIRNISENYVTSST